MINLIKYTIFIVIISSLVACGGKTSSKKEDPDTSVVKFTPQKKVVVDKNQTIVLTLEASGKNITYSIKDNDSLYFNINAQNGEITFKNPPQKGTYVFKAKAKNSTSEDIQIITIYIRKDKTAPVFTSDTNITVDENQLDAIQLSASDNSPITFSIRDFDSSFFKINNTGFVSFLNAPKADIKSIYKFNAIAKDTSDNNASVTVTINIKDLDLDNDGLSDIDEVTYGTDINNSDTDGDGVSDFDEIQNSTDPLDANSTYIPFVFKIDTLKSGTSNDNEFNISINSSHTYDYNVDCDNDGVFEHVGLTSNLLCTYTTQGVHSIAIQGTFPQIYFNNKNDKNKIINIEKWGTNSWLSMESSFKGCENLEINTSSRPNLRNVLSLKEMFKNAKKVNQDLSNWDVSNIQNMSSMFENASLFNGKINDWNTSNVISMSKMFKGANGFNQELYNFDLSGVTDTSEMFRDAILFNQEINDWNVSNVGNMASMFRNASAFDNNISSWDVSNVFTMRQMFLNSYSFNQDISSWKIKSNLDMLFMFEGVTLSTTNYDKMLNAWASLIPVVNNVKFDAGNSKYSNASKNARQTLIQIRSWDISDGGLEL